MKQAKILSLVILCITTFVWQADTFSQSLDSLLLANKNEISVYENVLNRYRENNNVQEIVKALQILSGLQIKKKNYTQAAAYNEEIIKHADKEKNYLWQAVAFNNLGFIYNALKDDVASANYFNKSYNLVKEQNVRLSDDSRASVLINIGVANANLGKLTEAQKFLN